jgi:anti-sigma factor RsiW
MDCTRYEELLFAGLDAELEPDAREQMARHAQGCARCRRLAAVVAGNEEPIPPDIADELAAEVFARTSGAAAIERLQRELPALAEADPGPDFVSSVLAATIGRETTQPAPARLHRPASPRIDLSGLWQRLALRPRLALEGSFVVTMLALLVFGLPSTTESPVRAFDSWWRNRTDAARELIENASESAQRGLDSLWNENGSGGVVPDNSD